MAPSSIPAPGLASPVQNKLLSWLCFPTLRAAGMGQPAGNGFPGICPPVALPAPSGSETRGFQQLGHAVAAGDLGGRGGAGNPRECQFFAVVSLMNPASDAPVAGRWRRQMSSAGKRRWQGWIWSRAGPRGASPRARWEEEDKLGLLLWPREGGGQGQGCSIHFDPSSLHLGCAELPPWC